MALGLSGLALVAWENRCQAGFCFDVKCMSSSICGQGCVCLKRGTEPMGECYSRSYYEGMMTRTSNVALSRMELP